MFILKRNGNKEEFNPQKIKNAISLAFDACEVSIPTEEIDELIENITKKIQESEKLLSVEDIQDLVEIGLMQLEYCDVSKAYIIYRAEHALNREMIQNGIFRGIINTENNEVTRENANMNSDSPAGMMMKFASETTKPFVDKELLSKDVREAVNNNYIHIHDKDYYPTRSLTCLREDSNITLKNKKGEVLHTTFKDYFKDYETNGKPTALKEYTYIEGRNGWTKINSVTKRLTNDKDQMFFIRTHKGIGLHATGTHKIPVINSNEEEELKQVYDIKIGDKLLEKSKIVQLYETEYIDVAQELLKIPEIDDEDILICGISDLRGYLKYKYKINNLSKYINSKTSKNGTQYITLSQYNDIINKLDIPHDVKSTLSIKVHSGKDCIPMYLPISPELVELIGYIHSEGSLTFCPDSGNYQMTFVNYDSEMNKRFEEAFSKVFTQNLNIRRTKTDDGTYKETGRLISSKLLVYLFKFCFGKTSVENINIPDFIMNGTDEIKWHYISSLIDGDGSIKEAKKIVYSTVSSNFANKLCILFKSLGVECSVSKQLSKGSTAIFHGKEYIRNFDIHYLKIMGYDYIKIVLDNLTCIKQKSIDFDYAVKPNRGLMNDPDTIVDIIEEDSNCIVYDLETVEHWFVANNYIVHNCLQTPLNKILSTGFKSGHGESRGAKRIETAAILAAISMETTQNEQHGGQAIPAFDFYMAPYVKLTFEEELQKAFELIGQPIPVDYTVNEYEYKPINSITCMRDKAWHSAMNATIKRVHQAMESFIHNMNQIHSRGGNQVVFSSINYGTDTSPEGRCVIRELLKSTERGVGNGATAIFPIQIWKCKSGVSINPGDKNYDLYLYSCKVSAKRFFPNYLNLDATFNQHELWDINDPERYKYEVATMGCRTRVFEDRFGEKTSIGRGNLSFTTLNLPKLAIEVSLTEGLNQEGKIAKFYLKVKEYTELIAKQLDERYKFQAQALKKQFPFLMSGLWKGSENLSNEDTVESVLSTGTLGIGLTQ